jgi:glycosyltransferase involved in cell wall biosynthesis
MTFFLFPELHTRSKKFYFPLAIRASARSAQALIADSDSTRRDAIRLLHIPPGKISTVHLGVDRSFTKIKGQEELRRVRTKYRLPERIILYVGLVEPRKNLPGLIDVFEKLVQGGTDHDLVVVGRRGWSSEAVWSQVEALGLNQRVHFTGYVDRQELPLVYNLASIFVYPTRYEGFGLPVLEALACGVPVITTNASSLPEIAGDAAILVPPDDGQALHDSMRMLLDDPELRSDLSSQGLERAKEFTWEHTALRTLQVYRQVLEPG